jgi:hypothetical protein
LHMAGYAGWPSHDVDPVAVERRGIVYGVGRAPVVSA